MRWTEDQLRAIETRKKNLLVSAAAGSGKTALLIERIRRIVVEEKTSVDALLVLTFTRSGGKFPLFSCDAAGVRKVVRALAVLI